MKDILKKFQKIMMAATFAEAGEWDTAREMTPDIELSREPNWLNRLFIAITYAESGLQDEAVRFMEPVRVKSRSYSSAITKDLGLKGVQLMYGTVSI
jgi:hypothetical protein